MTISWIQRIFLPKTLVQDAEAADARLEAAKREAMELAEAEAATEAEMQKLCILTEDRAARIASAPPVSPRLASIPDIDWDIHEEETWDGSKA